jgi:hypothetical protein
MQPFKMGEQTMQRKPKKLMSRSTSFEIVSLSTTEDQEDYLSALRLDRYCKKFQVNDEPLPAPTRFLKGSPCPTFHNTESRKTSSLQVNRHLKRSVSEADMQALATWKKMYDEVNQVFATKNHRTFSIRRCLPLRI